MRKILFVALTAGILTAAGSVNLFSEDSSSLNSAMDLSQKGKDAEAINKLKEIIDSHGQDEVKARISLGLVFFKTKNYDLSLDQFLQVTVLKKESPMAYYFMGLIYEEKALKVSNLEAVELKKKAQEAWQNYIVYAEKAVPNLEEKHHFGLSKEENIKSAKKHIEMLKGELVK